MCQGRTTQLKPTRAHFGFSEGIRCAHGARSVPRPAVPAGGPQKSMSRRPSKGMGGTQYAKPLKTKRTWRASRRATKAEGATKRAARSNNLTANFAVLAEPNVEQQHKDVTRGDEGGGRHQNGGDEQQLHHERHGVRGLVAILLNKALSQNEHYYLLLVGVSVTQTCSWENGVQLDRGLNWWGNAGCGRGEPGRFGRPAR